MKEYHTSDISPMHPRAAALIESLELQAHPEGGHFREVHQFSDFRMLDARPDLAGAIRAHHPEATRFI